MSTETESKALLAYADEISVKPGQTIRFAVSTRGISNYKAEVVRILAPEAGAKAPPRRETAISTELSGDHKAEWQPIDAGSWGYAPLADDFSEGATVQAYIWPTLPGEGAQFILGTWSEDGRRGIGLRIRADGHLEAVIGDGTNERSVVSTEPLLRRHWYFVAASYDANCGQLSLWQEPADNAQQTIQPPVYQADTGAKLSLGHSGGMAFAAAPHAPGRPERLPPHLVRQHYNGKIDRPRLMTRALSRVEMAAMTALEPAARLDRDLAGAWDFAAEMTSEEIMDCSARVAHGRLYNMPTRASTGANWRAQEMNWQKAPELYGAIHFHSDDIHDCGWEYQHTLTIPETGWSSGVYALKLSVGDVENYVVFFLSAAPGRATSRVAFLAGTATYLVYSNLKARLIRDFWEVSQGRLLHADLTDLYLFDVPEIGLSTYDRHIDGSGVAYVSRLRPSTSIRPNGRLWNFPADLLYVDWLDRDGVEYDIVTDDGLHEIGSSALDGYDVLITGSHPEYYTSEMIQSVEGFLSRGGRLMYMGGNGFYWKCAYHPNARGVIELRRAEDGLRAWDAEPGEYYHSSNGEYGGLWRRNGLTPQMLSGVGFVAQGFDASSYYRRMPDSSDARAAFIFEGVESEIIGDHGLMGGGAAGMEIDAVDYELGSPAHTMVLARSELHSNVYEIVSEEITISHGANDVLHNPAIRAEMTFFETASGGAVFSTGSIAYAGSLSTNNFDNDCARIARNVLKRFSDQTLFERPIHVGGPRI